MTVVRTLKRLVLGETWLLPIGLGGVVLVCALLRSLTGHAWVHLGGFMVLIGVLAVLVITVARGALPRTGGHAPHLVGRGGQVPKSGRPRRTLSPGPDH